MEIYRGKSSGVNTSLQREQTRPGLSKFIVPVALIGKSGALPLYLISAEFISRLNIGEKFTKITMIV